MFVIFVGFLISKCRFPDFQKSGPRWALRWAGWVGPWVGPSGGQIHKGPSAAHATLSVSLTNCLVFSSYFMDCWSFMDLFVGQEWFGKDPEP